MIRYFGFFLLLPTGLLLSGTSAGQITIDTTVSAVQLANDHLAGPGVAVSAVQFFGLGYQKAYFDGSASNIGMADGVILGNGDVRIALGPQTEFPQTMWGLLPDSDDPDLTALVAPFLQTAFGDQDTTSDRSVLEMDLVPAGDSLFVTAAFASKEYPEWVCFATPDVAAIFLSGPGISGPFSNNAVNILTVPGSSAPVCPSTINPGDSTGGPGAWCAAFDPMWLDNTIYYVDNVGGLTVGYEGFTVPIQCSVAVIAGATYHIKFAIADVADMTWDSGLLLAGGSLRSNIPLAVPQRPDPGSWSFAPCAGGGTFAHSGPTVTGPVQLRVQDAIGRLIIDRTYAGSSLPVRIQNTGLYTYSIMANGQAAFGRFFVE